MDYSDERVKLAGEVLQMLWGINRATVKLAQQNAASLGITLQQMAVLNTLMSEPDLTLKTLTEKLMLAKSTMSVQIDGLVQAGFVAREVPAENRREVKLALTPKGIETARQSMANAGSYRAMTAVLSELGEGDAQELLRLNRAVLQRLETYTSNQ